MRKTLILTAILLASAAMWAPAKASVYGYSVANVNLSAGPSTLLPAAYNIKAGGGVQIHGCLVGFTWCDVSQGSARGWISGAYLQVDYQDYRYYVPYYAGAPATIGVPVVTYDLEHYWTANYSKREFYVELADWSDCEWDDELPPGWRDDWAYDIKACNENLDCQVVSANTTKLTSLQ